MNERGKRQFAARLEKRFDGLDRDATEESQHVVALLQGIDGAFARAFENLREISASRLKLPRSLRAFARQRRKEWRITVRHRKFRHAHFVTFERGAQAKKQPKARAVERIDGRAGAFCGQRGR